jgi:rhodanese-related sulfurtransferase
MKAAEILAEQGFQIIFDLDGGILQWAKDGMEIER